MHCFRKVTEDLYWVGASDRRIELFENIFPLSDGVSYNSYLLMDEKTVLFDAADYAVGRQFLENVQAVLNGRTLDYLVVNHMEPDHCAMIEDLVLRYPEVQIIGNAKTFPMISQFFSFDLEGRTITVKEGDTFSSGKHTRFMGLYFSPQRARLWFKTSCLAFKATATESGRHSVLLLLFVLVSEIVKLPRFSQRAEWQICIFFPSRSTSSQRRASTSPRRSPRETANNTGQNNSVSLQESKRVMT